MFNRIRADIRRVADQERTVLSKVGAILFNLGFHAVLFYRLSHWLHTHHLGALAAVVSYWSAVFTGAQISARATIGKGLIIYHPNGHVIGATAVIGDYCTLTQGNMIGQRRGGGDRPTIGDYLYAGAGAKILGDIKIGNRVRVAANSVVFHSLPDDASVIGVPAKKISHNG